MLPELVARPPEHALALQYHKPQIIEEFYSLENLEALRALSVSAASALVAESAAAGSSSHLASDKPSQTSLSFRNTPHSELLSIAKQADHPRAEEAQVEWATLIFTNTSFSINQKYNQYLENVDQAFAWLVALAHKKEDSPQKTQAQLLLGMHYANNTPGYMDTAVFRALDERILDHFQLTKEGVRTDNGLSGEEAKDFAFKWLYKAAIAGSADAQYLLAELLCDGYADDEVPLVPRAKSVLWLHRAASQQEKYKFDFELAYAHLGYQEVAFIIKQIKEEGDLGALADLFQMSLAASASNKTSLLQKILKPYIRIIGYGDLLLDAFLRKLPELRVLLPTLFSWGIGEPEEMVTMAIALQKGIQCRQWGFLTLSYGALIAAPLMLPNAIVGIAVAGAINEYRSDHTEGVKHVKAVFENCRLALESGSKQEEVMQSLLQGAEDNDNHALLCVHWLAARGQAQALLYLNQRAKDVSRVSADRQLSLFPALIRLTLGDQTQFESLKEIAAQPREDDVNLFALGLLSLQLYADNSLPTKNIISNMTQAIGNNYGDAMQKAAEKREDYVVLGED